MTAALLLLASLPAAPPPAADLKAPPGFTASVFSDNAVCPDIYTMTIDDAGRVLVAGRGYVRVLVDDDGDGRADRALDLVDGLKDGPMGLFAEAEFLYVVADGGLKRYRGYNGRDKLKGPPELLLALKTGGEHDAHAVRRGPDGWLYVLCGNMANVPRDRIDRDRSPIKDPIAGCLLRLSPDFRTMEVVADGFRNPYSFDFHAGGEPFTYDSDNERCVGLPWYEGCRFYHVVPGGNYGWRSPQLSQTWRKPPYFADVVPPIADLGRGSPTGVACYRHTQFPERYRGGFFLADWTFGRVHFVPLAAKDSTFAGKPEVFLEATGESGFAPTALAVHPLSGELFVSIGGRGTRGGVYRVKCDAGDAKPKPIPVAKRSLDYTADAAKTWLADAAGDDAVKRRAALELMHRWREKMGYGPPLFNAVKPNLAHDDRLVRAAAGRLVADAAVPTTGINDPQSLLAIAVAVAASDPDLAVTIGVNVLESKASPALKLEAARAIQLGLGDLTSKDAMGTVWEGYTFRKPVSRAVTNRVLRAIRPNLSEVRPPAIVPKQPDLDRELTRTIAALGPAQDEWWAVSWLGDKMASPTTDVRDVIHCLAAVAQLSDSLRGEFGWPLLTGFVSLDTKAVQQKLIRDRHWPLRIEEIASVCFTKNADAASRIKQFPALGQPEHLLFVKYLDISTAEKAGIFVAAAKDAPDYGWTPGLVTLLAALPPEESRPVLRELWDRGGLEDAIVPVLAAAPDAADRDKFVVGLKSLDAEVVRAAARALLKLDAPKEQTEAVAAIRALRRLGDDKATLAVRTDLAVLLRNRTGQTFGPDAKPWAEWFTKEHPKLAGQLAAADGFDPVAWAKREAGIRWDAGDAARGKAVFTKATCAACHDGGGAVGPSLVGVSKRFGRDDLLTAILQPSKDVPPRYRPTRITTADGKSYLGMIVYEAVDGVILQTGPDATVRLPGTAIESKRTLETSLMPAGLLDKLSDVEVADLLAYLRTQ